MKWGEQYYPVDESEKIFCEIADKCFAGDYLAFAEEYYRTLGNGLAQSKGQIAGHFDLIAKYNEGGRFFSEESPEYQRAALKALDKAQGKIIEVTTGAMARSLRKVPYPAPFLLQEIQRRGWKVILSSDCHDAKLLGYGFSYVLSMLKEIGFAEGQIIENPLLK